MLRIPSIRSPAAVRAFFGLLAFVMSGFLVAAALSDHPDKGGLMAVGAAGLGLSLLCIAYAGKVVRWEDSGGHRWDRPS